MSITTDTARLPLLLTTLRLPTVARLWPAIGETADSAARTLATLLEHEVPERANRRTARHLAEARLPSGKTIDTFDFAAAAPVSQPLPKATAGSIPAPTSCCSGHRGSARPISAQPSAMHS